jgi:hypothetical protein
LSRYLLFGTERYALSILRPLARAIGEQGGCAAWFFPRRPAGARAEGDRWIETVGEVRHFAPHAVLVPGNWVPDFFPGVKVEVFHGFNVHKRSDDRGHFRIRGFFDLYCTQGPDTTEPFALLARRHGHFRVVETGWPKMDPLLGGTIARPSGRRLPVVLYASTFTRGLTSTEALHDEIRRLSRSGRFDFIVTFHPKMPEETVRRYRALAGEHLRFVDTDDTAPLLAEADVMLSDTSSIVSEFVLLHRPVVTFRNRDPRPHMIDVTQATDVEAALARALAPGEDLLAEIRRYADRIHPSRDGRASERVLAATDALVSEGPAALRRKPVNLWRRLRARHALGYYRLR